MLDKISSAPAIAGASVDWREGLSPGDIVLYRFPIEGSGPLPQARPCLVLDTARFGEVRYAVLAYGTGAETAATHGHELQLTATEARAAGLPRPIRFVAARRMLVALDDPGLVPCATTGTPVIGGLAGGAHEQMNAVRAHLHAEADSAAGRRPARRAPRQGRHGSRDPRPVRVEYRYPRRRRRATRG